MLRRFGTFYAAAISIGVALVALTSDQLWIILGVGAAVAAIFALLTSRAVQIKLGIARSPAVKFREVHDEANTIIDAIDSFRSGKGPPTPRAIWEPRVVRFETSFWKLIDDVFYSRGASVRAEMSYKLNVLTGLRADIADEGWASTASKLMKQRSQVLTVLVTELPDE